MRVRGVQTLRLEPVQGSYLRLIDSCITQLKAQGPSRTCNESQEEEKKFGVAVVFGCTGTSTSHEHKTNCHQLVAVGRVQHTQ